MEREFYGEWQRLEDEATAVLIRPPARDGHSAECHAVLLPSFDDCRSYTLMASGRNHPAAPLGVRRTWRRHTDLAKFDGPVIRLKYGPKLEPTLEEDQGPVGEALVEDILTLAASLRVPAHARERTVGTDGESYVLSFGGAVVSTRFQWWGNPPPGWEGLGSLLRAVVSAVDDGLARRWKEHGQEDRQDRPEQKDQEER